MIKLPIRYFTDFGEDTDKLEFPKHTPAFDLIHENGYGIRFSENGTHEPFITNIYKERIDKAIKYIETHQLCYQSQYEEMSGFDNHLLDILKGENNG